MIKSHKIPEEITYFVGFSRVRVNVRFVTSSDVARAIKKGVGRARMVSTIEITLTRG